MLKRIIGTCVLALLASAALADNPRVLLSTSHGDIEIELDAAAAPITVENFLRYTDAGHYDGLIFHRVIPGFMIQGGGFDSNMRQRPVGQPIRNEADNGLKNDRYTIAMARTQVRDSATSQFFINLANNDFLNHGARDFVLAADHLAEHGVAEVTGAVVEEVVVGQVDEELTGGAVAHLGAGHGNGVAIILQAVIGFVPDRLADGALAHVAVKAAALDHEAGNHPVEDQAIIVPGIGVAQEVLHGDGSRLGIQLDFDITMAGAQQDAGVVGQGSAGEQGEDAGSDDSFQHSGLRTDGCTLVLFGECKHKRGGAQRLEQAMSVGLRMADDRIANNACSRSQGPVLAGVQISGRGTLAALVTFQLGGDVVAWQPSDAWAA